MMKKIFIVLLFALLLFSCETGTDIEAKNDDGSPVWTTEVPVSNRFYYGVGSAKLTSQENSRNSADQKARADLARKLEHTIKEASVNYTNDAAGSLIECYEAITMQVVNITMRGVKTEQRWVAPDGKVWSLVSFPIKDVDDNMELEANNYKNKLMEEAMALEAKLKSQIIEVEKAEALMNAFLKAAEAGPAKEGDKAFDKDEVQAAFNLVNGLMKEFGVDSADGIKSSLQNYYNGQKSALEEKAGNIDSKAIRGMVADRFTADGYEVE